MCHYCEWAIDKMWLRLKKDDFFRTPDFKVSSSFTISNKEASKLIVLPKGGSKVSISKESFVEALHFLFSNDHHKSNQCEIAANNNEKEAGSLCLATREKNNKTRCITYIVPILQNNGLIGICSDRRPRNKVWHLGI